MGKAKAMSCEDVKRRLREARQGKYALTSADLDFANIHMPRVLDDYGFTSTGTRIGNEPNGESKAEGNSTNFDGDAYDPDFPLPDGDIYTKGQLDHYPSTESKHTKMIEAASKSTNEAKATQSCTIKRHT